jgi:putative pyruvate formate lyase activating enzyme
LAHCPPLQTLYIVGITGVMGVIINPSVTAAHMILVYQGFTCCCATSPERGGFYTTTQPNKMFVKQMLIGYNPHMKCYLCPRGCGAERDRGEKGFCGAGFLPKVARAAAHFWEEPCISGEKGSGTVFFSGCNLRCSYCQNWEISFNLKGRELDAKGLRELFLSLCDTGVHNINLVTPTPYINIIAEALEDKLPVPVVFNCGGYENVEALGLLDGKIDIYLPDMKYMDKRLAKELSGAEDYPRRAAETIAEMFRQVGPYKLNDKGLMERGLIVRHLVLPGQLDNSKDVLDWFAGSFKRGQVMLSLMSQYTPNGFGGIDRQLYKQEYDEVVAYLYQLGIRDGFVQDLSAAATGYVPVFDME